MSRLFTRLERRLARTGRPTIGGWIAGGVPVLLLTTTRRRSGDRHVTPLVFHRDSDGSLLLIAANGAADWNPDWFHNLAADPRVDVEIEAAHHSAQATVLEGDQRIAAWPTALRVFPGLEAAQRESTRDIPLIRLMID
jgi:deazaflavin-dependent oxidoreductase (nitroreductase family)